MTEFWEEAFKEKGEMWGEDPAKSAVRAKDLFIENCVKSVLIPGIGYGRNAKIFLDNGMEVTGIEISRTAIDLASTYIGNKLRIYQGSVTEMPFDQSIYDGIFCHGLIYLLDKEERKKLLSDCFNQLRKDGMMIFTAITKKASSYGQGTLIGEDRFEMFGGVSIFFYDLETIQIEFKDYGIIEIQEVQENYPFYIIICKKTK